MKWFLHAFRVYNVGTRNLDCSCKNYKRQDLQVSLNMCVYRFIEA